MRPISMLLTIVVLIILSVGQARAVPFVTAYTDGESWNTIYAQGFSPFIQPDPDPQLGLLDLVSLDRFEFFKSGDADITESFQLAIVTDYFLNLNEFTTDHADFVALSDNTINGTASMAIGDPIGFTFTDIELTFGLDYAAIYVTNTDGMLTPIAVPSLIADYVETSDGSGVYVPESNYGDPDTEFQYAVSNFINVEETGSYLRTFDPPYADASFVAYYDREPVAGDYNNDGVVNIADYTLWQDNFGAMIALPNETATLGEVTNEDYDVWKTHFNQSSLPVGTIATGSTIPEPGSLLMLWTLLVSLGVIRLFLVRVRCS